MRIGIDLGGTKIEALALDDQGGILARRRVATPSGDYAGTVAAMVELVAWIESRTGQRGSVGVGTPGAISPRSGCIKNSNSLCLIGRPLREDLGRALGRPVRLANDADCFALSEAVDGAGQGCATMFGVILGTGVGGGVVAHGRLLQGPNAIAGEWGHNPLPWPDAEEWPGPTCYCGKRGCVETFLSGPGLEADFLNTCGQPLRAMEIAALAERGEACAQRVLARYEGRLARALAVVINILDPEGIVLGGGLSNLERLYDSIPNLWTKHVFSDTVNTRLLKAHHGDSSGVRGAAWLWPNKGELDGKAQEEALRGT